MGYKDATLASIGVQLEPGTSSAALTRDGRRALLGLEPHLVVIGLAGGLLSGLLGVGGGIVMVPLLVLWAHETQRDAHAISLGAIVPISLASVLTYGVAGQVRLWQSVALAAGSIVGARIGAGALARIRERPLKLVFGLFLAAVSILMLLGK